ncbi:MerR family transcriptional regulator [Georgenia faecalis]|uniref:MerR family transcriptional regulator n=1 Tax=Georgenia faecalis TaxID=2483799 RepID=A0ABV9D7S0_9MICO|nr:MerR family transcriptional regulator [Georgenia faecalis]
MAPVLPGDPPSNAHARERVDADGAPLTVAAVAGRLGVAASTLRTWDRRYGLGPSAHQAGSHRRYTPDDVARLETMRRLTLRGVAPADAARIATRGEGAVRSEAATRPDAGAVAEAQLIIDPLTLAAAAVEPDPPRLQRMLSRAVAERGIVETWTEVARPARLMLRQRDRVERPGMDPEGVLDFAVLGAVREVTLALERAASADARADTRRRGTALLYAGAETRLRAHVLGAGLLELGVRARIVRASATGAADILELVGSQGAGALAVLGSPPEAAAVVTAASGAGDLEVFLLGRDAPDLWLPRVRRVRTAVAAVHEIAGVLGADRSP